MRFGEEVIITLAGEEMILRPVSAADRLDAGKESRGIAAALEAADDEMRLIKAACIIAKGAYEGEKAVFGSGEEVLSRLTAEEIFEAAAEYDEIPGKPEQEADDGMRMNQILQNADAETAGMKMISEEADAAESGAAYRAGETDALPLYARRTLSAVHAREYAETDAVQTERLVMLLTGETDAKLLSDIFERDARRYDGGIVKY